MITVLLVLLAISVVLNVIGFFVLREATRQEIANRKKIILLGGMVVLAALAPAIEGAFKRQRPRTNR